MFRMSEIVCLEYKITLVPKDYSKKKKWGRIIGVNNWFWNIFQKRQKKKQSKINDVQALYLKFWLRLLFVVFQCSLIKIQTTGMYIKNYYHNSIQWFFCCCCIIWKQFLHVPCALYYLQCNKKRFVLIT